MTNDGLRIINTFPLSDPTIAALRAVPGVASVETVLAENVATTDLSDVGAFFGELPDGGLDRAPRLRWLVPAGAGVEDVALAALSARGVTVRSARGLHGSSMGEYCVGALLFAFQHQAARLDAQQRRAWEPEAGFATPLRGRTLAVLGYGSI